MQAVIRRGAALVVDAMAEPTPGPGQTLVRTLACGICGSDLHALHHLDHMVALGARAGVGPALDPSRDVVFGHEFCAEVVDHGPGPAPPGRLRPGTRVVSVPVVAEGAHLHTVGYSNELPGGFAERMVLTEGLLLEAPNGLSAAEAALTEPFAVGEHAVARSGAAAGDVIMVVGCGPVGLAVIAALKARGLGPVIASDFAEGRRRLAEVFGADEVVDPGAASPHDRWSANGAPVTGLERRLALMSGAPVRRAVIFECVGAPGVLQALIEAAPPNATLTVAGVCMQTDRIEPFLAIVKELDLRFVYGYSPEEYAAVLRRIAEGAVPARRAITAVIGRGETAAAFEALAAPRDEVKIILEPFRP